MKSHVYVDIEKIINDNSSLELYNINFKENKKILKDWLIQVDENIRNIEYQKYIILYYHETDTHLFIMNTDALTSKNTYREALANCFAHAVLRHLDKDNPIRYKSIY